MQERRGLGLCLNQLGIPYTHVNEGVYSHQWCRVDVNGTYWICDAYGMYVGPEPNAESAPVFLRIIRDLFVMSREVFCMHKTIFINCGISL